MNAGTATETAADAATALDLPWNVVVHDDPVNLMDYVTRVFMRVFGYPEPRAEKLMLEVHHLGRSVVWTGRREEAEHYTRQLQACQLRATIEKCQ